MKQEKNSFNLDNDFKINSEFKLNEEEILRTFQKISGETVRRDSLRGMSSILTEGLIDNVEKPIESSHESVDQTTTKAIDAAFEVFNRPTTAIEPKGVVKRKKPTNKLNYNKLNDGLQ